MPTFSIVDHGPSRSFAGDDPFRSRAVPRGDVVLHLGVPSGAEVEPEPGCVCTLVELGPDVLGVHTGEDAGREGDTRVGFARWRLGNAEPSALVEVVVQPGTVPAAVGAARAVFEDAGLQVAVSLDRAGRILDRMLRPYFNDALRALDNGLANAEDLDKTVHLGLGYLEGPIGLLHRTGLADHHDVTKALFELTGDEAFAPPRRAAVARARHHD